MLEQTPPQQFSYERWRHGGWYVYDVRYPSGACGCVSNNYEDKKWRIACDPRRFEDQPTFKTRDDAARAEWELARQEWAPVYAAAGEMFRALERMEPKLAEMPAEELAFERRLVADALATARQKPS